MSQRGPENRGGLNLGEKSLRLIGDKPPVRFSVSNVDIAIRPPLTQNAEGRWRPQPWGLNSVLFRVPISAPRRIMLPRGFVAGDK
ncbi:hypothetical protein ColTof4_09586 [Colletotrichum tofieldiae]|nr:hypothetical protein ColTof3_04936 [Colletotrichum tofieldiae]GKT77163.1 hypothetical protein ColTof4_09586 [Colletotrichum tofieldiae]GKT86448.1 hypothetical protein Ct61P_04298 [Colletotrichum tofieldiae]